MKRAILAVISTLLLASCTETNQGPGAASGGSDTTTPSMNTFGDSSGGDDTSKAFIPVDTANKMISSYLTSVGAPADDSNLRSVIIDANALRRYLTTNSQGRNITQMKLMFAHTQNYINAGNTGKNCGYRTGALTIVMAGIDSAGNYVMYPGNQVMDHGLGCPHNCPTKGTSANDLLPQ